MRAQSVTRAMAWRRRRFPTGGLHNIADGVTCFQRSPPLSHLLTTSFLSRLCTCSMSRVRVRRRRLSSCQEWASTKATTPRLAYAHIYTPIYARLSFFPAGVNISTSPSLLHLVCLPYILARRCAAIHRAYVCVWARGPNRLWSSRKTTVLLHLSVLCECMYGDGKTSPMRTKRRGTHACTHIHEKEEHCRTARSIYVCPAPRDISRVTLRTCYTHIIYARTRARALWFSQNSLELGANDLALSYASPLKTLADPYSSLRHSSSPQRARPLQVRVEVVFSADMHIYIYSTVLSGSHVTRDGGGWSIA